MPEAPISRRQLTLFVAEPWRSRLNRFRQSLDPVQASLIAAHVTLAREDEIELLDLASLLERAASWSHGPINLSFGQPKRFFEHGVLLPCEQGQEQFLQLRRWLLQDQEARAHEAHLTLAHPRNTPGPLAIPRSRLTHFRAHFSCSSPRCRSSSRLVRRRGGSLRSPTLASAPRAGPNNSLNPRLATAGLVSPVRASRTIVAYRAYKSRLRSRG